MAMELLSYHSRPELNRPIMIAAFEGWNDAGEAASMAMSFLHKTWKATEYAVLEAEEFFDFTVRRPQVKISKQDGETKRKIVWPSTLFSYARLDEIDRDVILVSGTEPSIRWHTFCRTVLEVAVRDSVELTITLGALLSDVAHTRPVPVIGAAYDAALASRLGLLESNYEGPTGILGVLHSEMHSAGLDSAGFWAQVPFYVQSNPSPKAALSLIRNLSTALGFQADTGSLEKASEKYELDVNEAVDQDPELREQLTGLEQRMDAAETKIPTGEELAAELEAYLRGLSEQ